MGDCNHIRVNCINPYEIVRKYRCDNCGLVMMCECDRIVGTRFLSHQLTFGTELRTQDKIPVTAGFQKSICNSCSSLPEPAAPKAQNYGSSSKIRRYYWREILTNTMSEFADWVESQGETYSIDKESIYSEKHAEIEKRIVERYKVLHATKPKYQYAEESSESLLKRLGISKIDFFAIHEKTDDGLRVVLGNARFTPEDFVIAQLSRMGYTVIKTESRPFHVIFGTYFWMLICDPGDEKTRVIQFGERSAFERQEKPEQIRMFLPSDFGTAGYYERNQSKIEAHLELVRSYEDHRPLFDYWLQHSRELRQYLWAHDEIDIKLAREILDFVNAVDLEKILRYLVMDYWRHYLGWPDLFLIKDSQIEFVEVKSSNDRLSEDQKRWIVGNATHLQFGFRIAKIHNVPR